jgi:hypothetical protein
MAAIASFQLAKGKYEDPTCEAIWHPAFNDPQLYSPDGFSEYPFYLVLPGLDLPFSVGLYLKSDFDPATIVMITEIEENPDDNVTNVHLDVLDVFPGYDEGISYFLQSGIDITGSHASGLNTVASGIASHAEGSNNIASGTNAHAEGSNNIASGTNAHAEGKFNIASGLNSHASGMSNIASGEGAFAHGDNCTSDSYVSVALGASCKASAAYSMAQNNGCETLAEFSHATGNKGLARLRAQYAHGNSSGIPGGNQYTRFVDYRSTANATPIINNLFQLPANSVMGVLITVICSNADGTVSGFFQRKCIVKRTTGNTSLSGAVQTIGTDIVNSSPGSILVEANNTNTSLNLTLTGKASTTIRWTMVYEAYEILFQ